MSSEMIGNHAGAITPRGHTALTAAYVRSGAGCPRGRYARVAVKSPHCIRWLALIAVLATLMVSGCIRDSVSEDEKERAIEAAYQIYEQEQAAGTDFSNGPCIAEELEDVPGWSVDVAHDPRQDVDNEPENQCQFYRDGKTKHFIELDPDGNLIRAR